MTDIPLNRFVRWAFYAFVFSIPLEYPDRTIPLEVDTITGSLFLAIALTQPRLCFRRPPAAFWGAAAFLWVYLAHTLFVEHAAQALKLFGNALLVTMLFWVSFNIFRFARIAPGALTAFVLGCGVVATFNVLGIATRAVVTDVVARRIVFGQDANRLGGNMALALIMVFALVLTLRTSMRLRLLLLALTPVLAWSLALANSRGAIVAVIAGAAVFLFDTRDARTMFRHAVVALVAILAVTVMVYRSDRVWKRFERTFFYGSMSGREVLYPAAWQMIRERPIVGWGPVDHNYELALRASLYHVAKRQRARGRHPSGEDFHNVVLDTIAELGLLGAIPLFGCLTLCVIGAWKARAGPYGAAPLALLAALMVLSMNTSWQYSKQGWVLLALAAASGAEIRRKALCASSTSSPCFPVIPRPLSSARFAS